VKTRTAKILAWNLYTLACMTLGFMIGMLVATAIGIIK
jgi:hypothetical protein